MIPLQEIKTSQVPIIVTNANIPIITLTEPDPDFNENDEDELEVEVVPEIAVSPPSPRPGRKQTADNDEKCKQTVDITLDADEDSVDDQIEVPQIKITVQSPPENASIELKPRHKPPPLTIPNSNFQNFDEENENVNKQLSQNVPKDAMSKPDQSLSSRMTIELGERTSTTPNPNQQDTPVKVNFKLFFSCLEIHLKI